MIGEGMQVRFVPHFNRGAVDSPDELRAKTISGKIVYINWEHKVFWVEFYAGTKQREAFKFCQIGKDVTICG